MIYVQRRAGVVCGVFAVPQPGVAEEQLAPDAAEVLAFALKPPTAQAQIEALEMRYLAPRFVREYLLQDFAAKAAAAGYDPAALPAYVRLKALDDQIAALRATL